MRFKSSGGTGDMTIRGKTFNLKSVDLFFAEKHQTPENASYERMKPFSYSPVRVSALYVPLLLLLVVLLLAFMSLFDASVMVCGGVSVVASTHWPPGMNE